MTENPYWTMDHPHGWSAEDIEHLGPETQKEVLKEWFYWNFEDPVERTPHDSSEGGYDFIWGGPYDAEEELRDEFESLGVPDKVINEVVKEVTEDGTFMWAPTFDRIKSQDST